jgi:hypothetical protein
MCPQAQKLSESCSSGDNLDRRELLHPIRDPRFGQVVRGHFEPNAIANRQADEMLAHLSGEMSQHLMLVIQRHTKHSAGKNGSYRSFKLDRLLITHNTVRTKNAD